MTLTSEEPKGQTLRQPDMALMKKAYARWAPFYDLTYRRLTAPGRLAAVRAAVACGPNILEVGVGTGMALEDYPRDCNVIATDLSPDMLALSVEKVKKHGLSHVKGIAVMDACRLGFPDGAFDAVSAQMLITLVPDPEGALDEFKRVVKPGGEIILVNHFGVAEGPVARIEEAVAPLASKVGWSSAFKIARIESWAKVCGDVDVVAVDPMPPGGFFKVLRLRKRA
jgi:phosphatidylethanolamine/phosphatidyl-N-methylethanolamine N-methyltransferase